MIAKTVSHYKILEKLGEGGMGVVYKAQDVKLERFVALKFLPHHMDYDDEAKMRFIQEAKAASALQHNNICTIHEVDETAEKQIFICMDYYHGKTLKKKIAHGPLKMEETFEITEQIAAGISKSHYQGIIHRDLKPANIMITDDGVVKILDFGLAKLLDYTKITKMGTTLGTVAYMSPEQIQAEDVDPRSDLWSIGVILYEMLTGKLPFQGEYEAAIIYNILNEEPKSMQLFRSDVPENIILLISQLLQKDPAKRISNATEIIEQLTIKKAQIIKKKEEISIAVLYFDNMSAEKETDYFCAGMTEDLIIDLSKIKNLKIIPRSDVLPLRNKEVNCQQLGKTLCVNYILEGSVRKSSEKIRITAQLIDVQSGFQVWAERYDRLIEDIFDVQMEVSQKIAEALKISLTESEKQMLAHKPTADLRAYDLYMRGSEFLLRKGKKNNDAAVRMFEHVLSIDPYFSKAYSALAEAFSWRYQCYDGNRIWLEKMMEMNEKALDLDPDLIEAQFGIAMVYFHQKRFADAKRTFEMIIKKKNDFYPAYHWMGVISDVMKDYDTAISYYKKAADVKPYSEEPWLYLEMTYRRTGDLKLSKEAIKKGLVLAKRKIEVNPEDVITLSRMAAIYAGMGETKKALEAAKRVLELDPNDGLALYNCACTYTLLGKKKEALTYLKTALECGFMNISEWVQGDPDLIPIRDDPKFHEILSKFRI